MDPAGHVFVAFLPVVAYWLVRHRRLPGGDVILVLLAATQLPDVVDKPVAWTFGVTPSGRLIAHSIVVVGPSLIVLVAVARGLGYGTHGIVFAFGYLSHIAADFYPIVSLGTDYYYFPNLFWPLLEPNPDPVASFAAHLPEPSVQTVLAGGLLGLVCLYAVLDIIDT